MLHDRNITSAVTIDEHAGLVVHNALGNVSHKREAIGQLVREYVALHGAIASIIRPNRPVARCIGSRDAAGIGNDRIGTRSRIAVDALLGSQLYVSPVDSNLGHEPLIRIRVISKTISPVEHVVRCKDAGFHVVVGAVLIGSKIGIAPDGNVNPCVLGPLGVNRGDARGREIGVGHGDGVQRVCRIGIGNLLGDINLVCEDKRLVTLQIVLLALLVVADGIVARSAIDDAEAEVSTRCARTDPRAHVRDVIGVITGEGDERAGHVARLPANRSRRVGRRSRGAQQPREAETARKLILDVVDVEALCPRVEQRHVVHDTAVSAVGRGVRVSHAAAGTAVVRGVHALLQQGVPLLVEVMGHDVTMVVHPQRVGDGVAVDRINVVLPLLTLRIGQRDVDIGGGARFQLEVSTLGPEDVAVRGVRPVGQIASAYIPPVAVIPSNPAVVVKFNLDVSVIGTTCLPPFERAVRMGQRVSDVLGGNRIGRCVVICDRKAIGDLLALLHR